MTKDELAHIAKAIPPGFKLIIDVPLSSLDAIAELFANDKPDEPTYDSCSHWGLFLR